MRFSAIPAWCLLAFVPHRVASQDAKKSQDAEVFDCDAGLANSEIGWSPAKKAWCCSHKQKGCPPVAAAAAAAPASSVVPSGLTPPAQAAPQVAPRILASQPEAKADPAEAQRALNQELYVAVVRERSATKIQALLGQRADINALVTVGGHPGPVLYHLAHEAKADDKQVASFAQTLLGLRADLDWKDSRGRTPLFMAAVAAKNVELVKAFKDSTNKDPHKAYGVTALQLAARDGHEEIVKALVDMGADNSKAHGFAKESANANVRRLVGLKEPTLERKEVRKEF